VSVSGRIGIREVADRAGVSITTVSNVLNKPGRVSEATVTRVTQIMDELGFVRNELARQLRTGGTTTLGMVVLNVANPFFADLAHATESSAEEVGYTVVLGSSDQSQLREERYLELFEEQRLKGTLIAPLNGVTPTIRRLRDRGMPVVVFDDQSYGDEFCSIALDGRQGGYLAARHLIETGRTHIAFLGGPLRQVEDRWSGAMRACSESSGVRLSHIDTADQKIADGRAVGAIIEAMSPDHRPDAVFAANDLLALGLLQALVLSPSISVPRDLAIIGYDDIDYAESASLPLSTIRQPVELLADAAVRLVLDEAENGKNHRHEWVHLAPELIVRESTPVR
jgi:LacI family transcriptional regulator